MSVINTIIKYLFIFLMLLFAFKDYTYLLRKDEKKKKSIIGTQIFIVFLTVILGYTILIIYTRSVYTGLILAGILVYFAVTLFLWHHLYPKASMLLVNNMLLLLGVGFIMIARICMAPYIDRGETLTLADLKSLQVVKQLIFAAGGTVIAFVIPVIIRRMLHRLQRLTWLYAGFGLAALLGVLALAQISGGAKLSITVGGVSIQFSEIVKITLVFFLAARLSRDVSLKSVVQATVVAALHVIILVLSTDLGTSLVFFVTYLVMIYVATRRPVYPIVAFLGGVAAAIASYYLFSHVKIRVDVFRNPLAVGNTTGYQTVRGLCAIGSGGWLGLGLCRGLPHTIPVSSKDFIFAALCEEFGAVFCIGLLMVCMSMYLLIVNISMTIRKRFYKLIAIGLGTVYAFQVFLTVGGVTNCIPMTGITLPLVSYGGSSVVSTIIMFAIIEGFYLLREDEEEEAVIGYKKSSR
ncbi:MAG: FtsW/RodA/SpoVE family cell cycle protein [Lachnospiraceae bacterium]|nr:FtsW/RodA/SpoVE family cell cycle protein [Lachnospiraceae bacterium]